MPSFRVRVVDLVGRQLSLDKVVHGTAASHELNDITINRADAEGLLVTNRTGTAKFVSDDNAVKLLVDGLEAFGRIADEIKLAEHSINMTQLFFAVPDKFHKDNEATDPATKEPKEKAKLVFKFSPTELRPLDPDPQTNPTPRIGDDRPERLLVDKVRKDKTLVRILMNEPGLSFPESIFWLAILTPLAAGLGLGGVAGIGALLGIGIPFFPLLLITTVQAKATFEILWWDVSIRVDKTLVSGEKPPGPAPIEVLPRLQAALGNPANWIGHLPEGQRQLVRLRAQVGAPTDVLLHPLGTLTVKQNVVPLNLDISRFGHAAPAGARRFTISSVSLGGESQATETVKEFFAPAEFFEMSDEEKLSRPSFEAMTAGIRFGFEQFVFSTEAGDCLEVKAIEFETWILDQETNEVRRSDPEDPTNPKALYQLTASLLGKQAGFGAAGKSELRRSGPARYRTTMGKYRIAKEGWSIVATADLTVQPMPGIEAGKPASYTEAVQALRKLKQEPVKAGGLQILRPSELSDA